MEPKAMVQVLGRKRAVIIADAKKKKRRKLQGAPVLSVTVDARQLGRSLKEPRLRMTWEIAFRRGNFIGTTYMVVNMGGYYRKLLTRKKQPQRKYRAGTGKGG